MSGRLNFLNSHRISPVNKTGFSDLPCKCNRRKEWKYSVSMAKFCASCVGAYSAEPAKTHSRAAMNVASTNECIARATAHHVASGQPKHPAQRSADGRPDRSTNFQTWPSIGAGRNARERHSPPERYSLGRSAPRTNGRICLDCNACRNYGPSAGLTAHEAEHRSDFERRACQ